MLCPADRSSAAPNRKARAPSLKKPISFGKYCLLDRISIGEITVRNVKGAVVEQGRLAKTLLGMSFLGRLSRTEMRSGVLLLED